MTRVAYIGEVAHTDRIRQSAMRVLGRDKVVLHRPPNLWRLVVLRTNGTVGMTKVDSAIAAR